MNHKCITIDGPAGSGKSTIAREIANLLGWTYIDTGAMYRAITLKILSSNISLEDRDGIQLLLGSTQIEFNKSNIFLDGKDVTSQIRSEKIDKNVSAVCAIREIRLKLVELQREYASSHPVVMDGRDIGTIVFPDAKYKFFLTASPEERARRRYNQMRGKGINIPIERIFDDIVRRDHMDSSREISPLKMAEDAHLIDTDKLGIGEVVEEIMSNIK